jgi:hypothetical protein
MNLGDAELQQTTGFPIVKGELSIGSKADMTALGIPDHDHLLLPMIDWPRGLFIWPVTNLTRDENGFCNAALGEFGLAFDGPRAEEIGRLCPEGQIGRSFIRGGIGAGYLLTRKGLAPDVRNWFGKSLTPIQAYELKAECRPQGLHFSISGQLAAADDDRAARDEPMMDGREFSVNAIIPYGTLMLKGIPCVGADRTFDHGNAFPSNTETLHRPRDPRRLHDLLIDPPIGPIVEGQILLAPEAACPPGHDRSAVTFLHMNINGLKEGSVYFTNAPNVQIRDNGFAHSAINTRFVTIPMLGRRMLEWFDRRDTLSLQLTGDALGEVGYAIDHHGRVVGPNLVYHMRPDVVRQQIRTISLRMAMEKNGLEISVDGELNDYDPAGNPRHRTRQVKPIRTYAVTAVVPWALLMANGFRFADRVRDF